MAESGLSENVFYAAIVGDIDFIKNWHVQGGDPDQGLDREFDDGVIYEQGTTLLMVAAYRGRLDVVRLLVEAGADVNVRLPDDGRSALAFAISRCHRLRSLLARGPRRARAGPETPEAVARLFGGVPDPCFWKVVEYAWLGDWRRP